MTTQEVTTDRQHLLDRLLDAVKQCQVRFGGRSELATDNDSRVVCLCAQFEIVLQHGMKKATANPLNALKQMTGITVTGLPYMKPEADQGLWPVIREHLTKHELQRFLSLKCITTDAGRGRAWLRSTLNEHSLERYLHMVLGSPENLRQYYEPWSFLLDDERSSMLPTMARGLCSILFAINIDKDELNGPKQVTPTLTSLMQSTEVVRSDSLDDADQEPVFAGMATATPPGPKEKKEKKKKKKKGAISIVSFNDSDTGSTVRHRGSSPKRRGRSRKESVESNESSSTGVESPAHTAHKRNDSISEIVDNSVSRTEVENDIHVEQNLSYIPAMEANGSVNYDINWNQPVETGLVKSETGKDQSDEVMINRTETSQPQSVPTSQNQSYPVNETDFLESRSNVDQSQLISFKIKTPPPSPYESAAAQYDRIRNSVDANDIARQLQNVVSVEENSTRSASPALEEKTEDSADDSSVSDKRLNITGRDSPLGGSRGSFHILSDQDAEAMYPIVHDLGSQQDETQSNDSSMLGFGAETENAALGLLLAQKGLAESMNQSKQKPSSWFGDGAGDDLSRRYQTMSKEELRQAVLAMMTRNDELQDQNRSLRGLLDSEMEHAAKLRGELETMKESSIETQDKLNMQVQVLSRENDVLKHQLKKYVGAVQMLRRDGPAAVDGLPGMRLDEPQPAIPEPKPSAHAIQSDQEADYERKLIQVAEMHGELMEFNDYISRQLKIKETIISRLKDELVDLRGPLPEDVPSDPNSPVSEFEPFSAATSRPLINVWIPSAFLRGKGKDAFHVYQIYVRIKDEEWNVYKRYTQFRDFHLRLRKSHAVVHTFEFPPKKAIGSKDAKFVEIRRKKLQQYLRCVLNFCIKSTSELSERPCKETLVSIMPFFNDSSRKPSKAAANTSGKPKLLAGRKGTQTPEYDGL
ncbi:sorting nexin-29-like isoform X1 [Amphiura filiformis]|uniref:sorting nexin-29-like isoform X1 n=1 Tax=Amphiura filiformis TaxID=82378 RepID=UPI003B215D8D